MGDLNLPEEPEPGSEDETGFDDPYAALQRILDNDIYRIRAGYGSMFAPPNRR